MACMWVDGWMAHAFWRHPTRFAFRAARSRIWQLPCRWDTSKVDGWAHVLWVPVHIKWSCVGVRYLSRCRPFVLGSTQGTLSPVDQSTSDMSASPSVWDIGTRSLLRRLLLLPMLAVLNTGKRTVAHIDPMMLGEEEDVSSECSSGCQSGWTAYLDQSSYDSPQPLVYNKAGYLQEDEEEEEEEDLSMVSDASSGPPHFHEEDEPSFCYLHSSTSFEGGGCLCSALTPAAGSAKSGAKRKRVEPEQHREHSSLLDDTASSTLLSYPKACSSPHPCSQSYFRPTCSLALYRPVDHCCCRPASMATAITI
ncbi:hypothetical protein GW17_00043537 [Ensete ventricosum]|nr:hypothetical protein GW17_00043537 [Ensete ventricosum]